MINYDPYSLDWSSMNIKNNETLEDVGVMMSWLRSSTPQFFTTSPTNIHLFSIIEMQGI